MTTPDRCVTQHSKKITGRHWRWITPGTQWTSQIWPHFPSCDNCNRSSRSLPSLFFSPEQTGGGGDLFLPPPRPKRKKKKNTFLSTLSCQWVPAPLKALYFI